MSNPVKPTRLPPRAGRVPMQRIVFWSSMTGWVDCVSLIVCEASIGADDSATLCNPLSPVTLYTIKRNVEREAIKSTADAFECRSGAASTRTTQLGA